MNMVSFHLCVSSVSFDQSFTVFISDRSFSSFVIFCLPGNFFNVIINEIIFLNFLSDSF